MAQCHMLPIHTRYMSLTISRNLIVASQPPHLLQLCPNKQIWLLTISIIIDIEIGSIHVDNQATDMLESPTPLTPTTVYLCNDYSIAPFFIAVEFKDLSMELGV